MSTVPEASALNAPVSLVTGSARRLGREIAWRLARDGHDIAVHAHRIDSDAEATCAAIRALGRRCDIFEADFIDEAATEALLPAVIERFGGVDAVVHNASMFQHDDLSNFGYAALASHACANAGSAVLLARGLERHLRGTSRSGALVLLLDQRLWNPNADYLSYALGKSMLGHLVPLLARALAPAVRVVGVAPGLTLGSALIDERRLTALGERSLTGRAVQSDEVADAVAFALRNRALTGSNLLVDAGYHLQPMARDFAFLEDADLPAVSSLATGRLR
ncbi:MAG TPA: SDR family oxidoreductase [Methylibium sp.]|uniref:SDR family oxidoreductase n=1 Tax=Methylibium sp. TaxID=2067992 RepID=UPI002DB67F99|nr:SDR family oxidoreductase [Methylibium sp.]HEU4460890.1 SDR family oxidoreductase [Methylibium sp.]